jgi:T4 superinfection immunity protein
MQDHLSPLVAALFSVVMLGLFVWGYFAPSCAARRRKSRNLQAIFIVNLLLDWTLIGWVIAWSGPSPSRPKPSSPRPRAMATRVGGLRRADHVLGAVLPVLGRRIAGGLGRGGENTVIPMRRVS